LGQKFKILEIENKKLCFQKKDIEFKISQKFKNKKKKIEKIK